MRFNQAWKAAICGGENKGKYFPANVPGNVQRDYAEFLGLKNLHYGRTLKALESTENERWSYKTALDYAAKPDERVYFVAEGIDYAYDIRLNGETIFSGEGMYTPVEIDITDAAKPGDELEVIIRPHPKAEGGASGTRDEARESCKPPFCYGWDWNPRLLVSGLWLPAYIETRGRDFIYACEPFYALNAERTEAKVRFGIQTAGKATITLLDPDGKVVYEGEEREFTVKDVRLWWCNGHGKPDLYDWRVATKDCERRGKIGFKTLRLVRNEGDLGEETNFPKGPYSSAITIELNGRRIFAKGSNLVSPDIFPGTVTDERSAGYATAAREANMNILRVWGGSGLCKPAFYDACDREGILVWQEFMLACNDYPDDDKYLETLEKEATSVIKKLRGHASLAFWCGGNELFNTWSGMNDQSLALRLLNKLCYELDPHRPFIPTSPMPGMGHGGYAFREQEGREIFEVFAAKRLTAYSEFGVPSLAGAEELRKIIPADELFPVRPTENWVYHHAFGAWQDNSWACTDVIRDYFGESASLAEEVDRSQLLQSIGYKAAFEEARRQWRHCSMAINWCFNEPWITAANNSIMTYPLVKKPAYYAVRESLRPVIASAKFAKLRYDAGEELEFELWLINDSGEIVRDTVTACLSLGGKEYELLTWDSGETAAYSVRRGATVRFVLPGYAESGVMTVKLKTASGSADSEYALLYRKSTPSRNAVKTLNL